MSEKKVALSSLLGQAWQQLQGMVLEEVRKKVEELAEAEPDFVQRFWEGFDASITFLKSGLRTWTYRLKTTNLAEGFFRNLRRFLGRFPGFVSPEHSERALGLCLLGADHA